MTEKWPILNRRCGICLRTAIEVTAKMEETEEYYECSVKKKSTSDVWNHFLKSTMGSSAKCKLCFKILKTSGGSTSSLRNHLKLMHHVTTTVKESNVNVNMTSSSSDGSSAARTNDTPPEKQRKISVSLETRITRMVAVDGMPFRIFVTSEDLKELFTNSGYCLPSSPNTIKKIVITEYLTVTENIRHELRTLLNKGYKFSVTADEWTSTRNRRYMNVNVHSPCLDNSTKFVNLGLMRINGSATATKLASSLEERLQMFGLSFQDIVSLTTDGASVMIKMGKSLPVVHQLCYAHAIQLAVVDVLYKKQDDAALVEAEPENMELDSDSDDEEDGVVMSTTESDIRPINDGYKPVIEKIRRVVKIFRKSPTKNDEILQKHVIDAFGKDYSLILDCKTRWSSLCLMMERFIKLYQCIQKSLIDIKSSIQFTDKEFELIKHIHGVLEILKGSVEVLCQQDATLSTADIVFKHMFKKLHTVSGIFGERMLSALLKRVGERYLLEQGVLKYLENPNTFFNDMQEEHQLQYALPRVTTETIKSFVVSLSCNAQSREVSESENNNTNTSPMSSLSQTEIPSFKNFKEELRYALATSTPSSASSQNDSCLPNIIHIEMALYENGAGRGIYLAKTRDQLMTIKPTSVESERAFSTAGYFCNKLRTRLSDATLDALILLKYYYISIKK